MTVWNDIRLAARLLAKDRGFTVAAVLALALGIAATSTIFTLGNGVFLRDLPFADPDRIVVIGTRTTRGGESRVDNLSLAEIRDLQASARLFDGIGAMDEVTMNVADEGRAAERYVGSYISANSFALFSGSWNSVSASLCGVAFTKTMTFIARTPLIGKASGHSIPWVVEPASPQSTFGGPSLPA